ncbi:hypothetical protein ASO20_01470 [Mycoplasma sp. (ex Biomphalaria glabrata)]|uniref:orotidine-5'-phosphate decarboxylase n=1 Tax=Mycoplasma sp. (ex Biomphalaria glabrata) TaxID=1749074 RepID=UPI00073AC9C2|nr:orotidine-5'-phosphate decarboxylase [Mycoplasma sp. (ex Biomphalaria glabrata)]ALV23320.1 hypothetical protein ASO20_01470 [Mycoplasma sp. (ex Biomphalaria glabrata)]
MMVNNRKNVIISCDFSSKQELYFFLNKLGDEKVFLKLGMEIIYSEGLDLIQELKNEGHKIFLDLKLHDIPNTVNKAIKALTYYEPDLLTIHLSSLISNKIFNPQNLNVIAVTVLTSIKEADYINYYQTKLDIQNSITHQLTNTDISKLYGIVCSPQESKMIKRYYPNLKTICPGIRQIEDAQNDQERIMTPSEARDQNIDYIVVGRPITQHPNPLYKYLSISKEFNND